jgi:cbb3-type cytochrome oxidase subunit 3
MNSTSVFQSIGDFFQWTFTAFEVIGNGFNTILVVLGFVGITYWMYRQSKYTAEAKRNSTHV